MNECTEPGCHREGKAAKGKCWMHYARMRRQGDPGPAEPLRGGALPPCSVKGCKRRSMNRRQPLCKGHYDRLRNTGSVGTAAIRPKRAPVDTS